MIDSMVWAIKMAESIVDMGLRHSKLSWPEPPAKRVVGYDFVRRPTAVAAD